MTDTSIAGARDPFLDEILTGPPVVSAPPPPPPPPSVDPIPAAPRPDVETREPETPDLGYFVKVTPRPAVLSATNAVGTDSSIRMAPTASSATVDKSLQYRLMRGAIALLIALGLGYGVNVWLKRGPAVYTGTNDKIDSVAARALVTPIAGVSYRERPDIATQAQGAISTDREILGVKGWQIVEGGTPGFMLAVEFSPEDIGDGSFRREVLAELNEVKELSAGGKPAFAGTMTFAGASVGCVVAFYENQVVLFVSPDQALTETFATQILSAAP